MDPLNQEHYWHKNSWQTRWSELIQSPVYAVVITLLTERIKRATVPAQSGLEVNAMFNSFRDGQFDILNALEDLALPPVEPMPQMHKAFQKNPRPSPDFTDPSV